MLVGGRETAAQGEGKKTGAGAEARRPGDEGQSNAGDAH
jgi:hypothetical protein